MVKCISEGLGVQGLLRDMGTNVTINSITDASAARGIIMRKGSGRIKHLEAQHLWVQEKVNRRMVTVTKVGRIDNPSDLLTHDCTAREINHHLIAFNANLMGNSQVVNYITG